MRDEDRVKLWDAINAYAITCGGDPSRFVYGNTPRQKAVTKIETLARAVAQAAREDAALLALGIGQTIHEGTKYAEGYDDGARDAARAIVLGAVQPAVCDQREVDRADAILDTLRSRSAAGGSK